MKSVRLLVTIVAVSTCLFLLPASSHAGDEITTTSLRLGEKFTVVSNLDGGYRRTQFYVPHYNTGVFQWDSRAEFWLPPFRKKFSWGPYLRLSGITGLKSVQWLEMAGYQQTQAFPDAWLAGPGAGLQVYPFSSGRFRGPKSKTGKVFGPLRIFGEYNRTDFLGAKNTWRPRSQTRAGVEYWKAINVNEPQHYWWLEIWNGLYWQSSNEFNDRYDSIVFANSWRSGIRKPHSGAASTITPYVAIESSRTKYDRGVIQPCAINPPLPKTSYPPNPNPCDFYWENRFLVGGGLRFAPSLKKLEFHNRAWLNRFVVYGEYLNTAAYYGPTASTLVPRFDVRAGISASIGQWYK